MLVASSAGDVSELAVIDPANTAAPKLAAKVDAEGVSQEIKTVGKIALIAGGYIFCRRQGLNFWQTADVYVVTMPVGLGLGRLGNFINAELFGRVTDVPWAMVFPGGGPLPRHPSQLYECLLEGVLLFTILWQLKDVQHRRGWPAGAMLAAFLILYGLFRSFAELFREPDAHIGFLWGAFTMGQLLSGLMIVAGGAILFLRRKIKQNPD